MNTRLQEETLCWTSIKVLPTIKSNAHHFVRQRVELVMIDWCKVRRIRRILESLPIQLLGERSWWCWLYEVLRQHFPMRQTLPIPSEADHGLLLFDLDTSHLPWRLRTKIRLWSRVGRFRPALFPSVSSSNGKLIWENDENTPKRQTRNSRNLFPWKILIVAELTILWR